MEVTKKARKFLEDNNIRFAKIKKRTYHNKIIDVFVIQISRLSNYESFVRWIEKKTKHRINLYNADIPPELLYLYKNNLTPCLPVEMDSTGNILQIDGPNVPLTKTYIFVLTNGDIRTNKNIGIKEIIIDGISIKIDNIKLKTDNIKLKTDNIRFETDNVKFETDICLNTERKNSNKLQTEKEVLERFVKLFIQKDPDVIFMEYAFSRLPYLVERLKLYNIECPFHRFDPIDIKYKGGRPFFTYGTVYYRDYAIRLRGRFLIDTTTSMGSQCDADAIAELCQLSGVSFQQIGSRSFGAVFQGGLVKQFIQNNYLVPFKEKPIDNPISLYDLMKADRAGHTFDPKIGMHKNVAEIDFASMYPWIMYNHNISADTIQTEYGPFEKVPEIFVKISRHHKGIIPITIKPFIDRRMYYKKHPTIVNKRRAIGLKWVLVSSNGYLRFREFKLGLPSSHMAVGAYAREIILIASKIAEDKGYEIVHGIVDALYIKKINGGKLNNEEIIDLCKEIQIVTGIPIDFEGIFKWIVFLPSVNDSMRPVPTRYYGIFTDNKIKARGIEVRQRSSPVIVKYFQQRILELISECNSKKEILEKLPEYGKLLRKTIRELSKLNPEMLVSNIRLSKINYKHNIPQKIIVEKMKEKGITPMPGQNVKIYFGAKGICLPEDAKKPDTSHYKALLVRSLYSLLQVFGANKKTIMELADNQKKLMEFIEVNVKHVYVPIPDRTKPRKGLSERLVRRRLEGFGYEVWRGAMLRQLKEDDYPNVKRRYQLLFDLLEKHHPGMLETLFYLNEVHHGMPDYICFRDKFVFVECKLGHEQLSHRQKICIRKLQDLGFEVEVHKLTDPCTKIVEAIVDLSSRRKKVLEKQMRLKVRY